MKIYTVEQINTYLKNVIKELPYLDRIYISGEVSNVSSKNGIMYFTLKDDTSRGKGSQLKCIMFSSDNYKLKFTLENGMKVICFGQVDLYIAGGYHQLIVRDIQPQGKGALTLAFEQLF
ncbi:MAG: exodeoxyribonuclease VII large subunit, partial [Eubacterium sp.]|nr:exodeoxyribonuclease VII large subunit [Eubacterium sp.]